MLLERKTEEKRSNDRRRRRRMLCTKTVGRSALTHQVKYIPTHIDRHTRIYMYWSLQSSQHKHIRQLTYKWKPLLTFQSRIRFNPDRNSFIWLYVFFLALCVSLPFLLIFATVMQKTHRQHFLLQPLLQSPSVLWQFLEFLFLRIHFFRPYRYEYDNRGVFASLVIRCMFVRSDNG